MKPRSIVVAEEKEEKSFIATVAYRTDKLSRSSSNSGNLCSVSLKELCLGNILVSL